LLRLENVRHRLTLWYVTVFGLLLVLFVCGATLLQYVQLRRQIFHAEIQDVETVEGLLSFSSTGALELHENYHNHPQHILLLDRYMEVLSARGDVLLRNDKLHGQGLGGPPFPGEGQQTYNQRSLKLNDGTRLFVISHVHSISNEQLLIRLGYSTAPVWKGVKEFVFLLLVAVPFALFIAGIASYRMALHTLRPVDDMASRAATITASDLSQRLPVENPRDEFGHMASVFNELLRRLEESFGNLKRFTADASHELRTPLASIRSVGEVGLQRSHSADEYRDIIGSMLEEVNRLTQMVEGLLTMARADSGYAQLEKSSFSAIGLVEEVVNALEMLAEDRGQQLSILGDASIVLQADRMLLQRALGNIIENAIKYSPASTSIFVRVYKSQEADTEHVVIEVEDQGGPIPEAAKEKVFERFFRIDESRSREAGGAGLGLAIAKWGVAGNGGTIYLREGQGSGNCFVISLPSS
jgi:heavy metal sensor kinase